VASQNDRFRKACCLGERDGPAVPGRLVYTRSFGAREPAFIAAALKAIGEFENFQPDNDPERFHDFGAVEVDGEQVWFKIDFYDRSFTWGAEDPSDLTNARRVLTILFPSDW